MNDPTHLFARDGHVTMLSLDRYDAGEFDDANRRLLEEHVETCGHCRDRFAAVSEPQLAILPPPQTRHDTGSVTLGYLATTAGITIAASLVAFVTSSLWPSPRVATQAYAESVGVASSYTSVAQGDSEPSTPGLELELRGTALRLHAEAGSTLAIAIVGEEEDGGDTGGRGADLGEILLSTPSTGDVVTVAVPRAAAGTRIVAIACADPTVALQAGDSLPDDGECTVRDVPFAEVDTRDS